MASQLKTNLEKMADDYQSCLILANSMKTIENYKDTTATAEDIRKGKIAYSNGERIEGNLEVSDCNATFDVKDKTTFTIIDILKEVDFNNIDTSKITSFVDAFSNCKGLEKIIGNIDCSSATNLTRMFSNCSMLTEVSLINTNNVTNMTVAFNNCKGLIRISEMDTSKVTTFSKTFYGCTNLVTVPVLNMNSITALNNLFSMFDGCTNLSDESLNNIMASCITAKTTSSLSYIGLSAYTTRCQSLSNYAAFIAAGWTV